MPLKHDSETWLVFLLGLLTVLAGIVCVFLPPVSVALWPWVIVFFMSLVYPFALYPYLKERRADNPFRVLHFAPAAVFLLWLFADLAAGFSSHLATIQQLLTWHGGILPVAAALLLLALFCLSVIRQRVIRLLLIGGLLAAVVLFGFYNNKYQWDTTIAAHLWGQSGALLLAETSTMSGASASEAETRWRDQLRLMEERRRAIEEGRGSGAIASRPPVQGSRSGAIIASNRTIPPHLPYAGPTADVLIFLTMSGFTTALHRRTMQRRSVA